LEPGADNFEVVQEPYMTALSVIPGYTNATAAKWQGKFCRKDGTGYMQYTIEKQMHRRNQNLAVVCRSEAFQ